MSIFEFLNQPIDEVLKVVPDTAKFVSKLRFASALGLGYLQLFQKTDTLSGGESQRLKLAAKATERKTFSSVVLDEPFRGVDALNANRLLSFLINEAKKGVSVFLVEHNPQVLSCCSYLVEFGPGSGLNGGKIMFNGKRSDIDKCPRSLIRKFL